MMETPVATKENLMAISPWHHTSEYDNWQADVIEACKNTCYITGMSGNDVKLDTHHVFSASKWKGLVYTVSNGILLKSEYHKDFHLKFMGGYRVPTTDKDLVRYKKYVIKHKIKL